MSQHPSLKSSSVGTRHRNVLKRHERIRDLHGSEIWGDRNSAFNLPKVKLIKLKVKKAKAGKETEGQAEGAAGAAGAPQAQGETSVQKAAPKPTQKAPAEKGKGKEKA